MVAFELAELRGLIRDGMNANERALAACGGHNFVPTNPYLRVSYHRCRRCGGISEAMPVVANAARAAA